MKRAKDIWNDSWKTDGQSKELFQWIPTISAIPSSFRSTYLLTQLLTGHGRFPFYFQRFNIKNHSQCFCGMICQSTQVTIYVVETVGATMFRNMKTVVLQSRNNVVATVITLQKCPLLKHCGNCVGQPLTVSCSQQLPKHCFYPAKSVLS